MQAKSNEAKDDEAQIDKARNDKALNDEATGFLQPILGDGRPLLLLTAGSLFFAGGFAIFLAATGEFLPHDIHYLGMSAADLCRIRSCRVVDFMVHDRYSFGGVMCGVAVLYVWLVVFPLKRGEQWAWWALWITGAVGFAGFLTYLGYGYLDTWHGAGTLLLLPVFLTGMVRARRLLDGPLDPRSVLRPGVPLRLSGRFAWGRILLLLGAGATAIGGLTIMWVGVTDTFVPEDLAFMGISARGLGAINPRLIPLLAHDRAGFGGGVLTMGLTTLLCLWCARPARNLHQSVAVAGFVSLTAALTVHGAVGYTDLGHLVPALAAALTLVAGLALGWPGAPGLERGRQVVRR